MRWAASLPRDALVVFEATSGCDGPLIAALCARGIRFARVKPRQAREFARALGVLAKTDRVDARILAEMGRMLPLEATAPPDHDRTRLADVLRRRKQLVETRKAEKVRRHNAGQPAILREIEAMIALLDQRIADLDHEIAALIAASPALAEQARLLSAVPGIGPQCWPRFSASCQNWVPSAVAASPPSQASPRTPGKAGPGAARDGSAAADARSAKLSTSQL